MKNEFVKYEQALALKELGFDEQCFSFYNIEGELYESEGYYRRGYNVHEDEVIAPLYQQVFSFFREKYKLYPEIGLHDREDEETWRFTISILGYYELAYNQNVGKEPYHKTYEEAEQACLDKLIEIVKNKSSL